MIATTAKDVETILAFIAGSKNITFMFDEILTIIASKRSEEYRKMDLSIAENDKKMKLFFAKDDSKSSVEFEIYEDTLQITQRDCVKTSVHNTTYIVVDDHIRCYTLSESGEQEPFFEQLNCEQRIVEKGRDEWQSFNTLEIKHTIIEDGVIKKSAITGKQETNKWNVTKRDPMAVFDHFGYAKPYVPKLVSGTSDYFELRELEDGSFIVRERRVADNNAGKLFAKKYEDS